MQKGFQVKAYVVSIQKGKVANYGDASKKSFEEKAWQTASFKEPILKPVFVSFNGLHGDEVADTVHHGGVDKAVFANSYENYPCWEKFLQISPLPMGALAENLTLSGVHESTVCLGDIHHIGSVILRVSQPRKPCWKIAKKWNAKHFTEEIYTSGLSGWYYQVLQEGLVCKNDTIFLQEKGKMGISILEANWAFKKPEVSKQCLRNILSIPSLASSYLESIKKRLSGEFSLEYMNT